MERKPLQVEWRELVNTAPSGERMMGPSLHSRTQYRPRLQPGYRSWLADSKVISAFAITVGCTAQARVGLGDVSPSRAQAALFARRERSSTPRDKPFPQLEEIATHGTAISMSSVSSGVSRQRDACQIAQSLSGAELIKRSLTGIGNSQSASDRCQARRIGRRGCNANRAKRSCPCGMAAVRSRPAYSRP